MTGSPRFFREVMMNYGVAVAVAIALSGSARANAQAQPPQERINAALTRAQQVGTPVSLLESKIAEGKAKGVSLERIAVAIERRQAALERASEALRGEADAASTLAVGADAIEAGVSEAVLRAVGGDAPRDRRNVAIAALTELVHQGHTPEAALARVRTAPSGTFDAVISDIRMPKMDGMQLLHALAQEDPQLPVILLTAHGSVDSAVEAVKAGAFDYLEKPFEIEQIKAVLGKAVATRERTGASMGSLVSKPSPAQPSAAPADPSEEVGIGEGHVAKPDARGLGRLVGHGRRVSPMPRARVLGRRQPGIALRSGHEPDAPRCRWPLPDRPLVGEPRRAADPRGDGGRRVRRPALPR